MLQSSTYLLFSVMYMQYNIYTYVCSMLKGLSFIYPGSGINSFLQVSSKVTNNLIRIMYVRTVADDYMRNVCTY